MVVIPIVKGAFDPAESADEASLLVCSRAAATVWILALVAIQHGTFNVSPQELHRTTTSIFWWLVAIVVGGAVLVALASRFALTAELMHLLAPLVYGASSIVVVVSVALSAVIFVPLIVPIVAAAWACALVPESYQQAEARTARQLASMPGPTGAKQIERNTTPQSNIAN